MAIQDWTKYQWQLVWEMVQENTWNLHRYVRKEDEQIDVGLDKFGTWDEVTTYKKAFGGRTARQAGVEEGGAKQRKGSPNEFDWKLDGEELDNFLDNLWIMISKKDPYGRSTDVRQAQDIRRRVREGNSYPLYDPRSAKRNREGLGLQRPRLLRHRRGT